MMRKPVCATLAVMMSLLFSPLSQAGQAWGGYKARFFKPEGRLVDTGHRDGLHTEGPGFGMFMAGGDGHKEQVD